MNAQHACTVDFSRETGSLVACTCGFVVGPFSDKANAVEEARHHRLVHAAPSTPEQRERHNARQRAKRAAARERAAEA